MVISGSFYHAHHTRHGRTDLSSILGVETRPEADARRMHQNEAKRGEKDHGAHNSARCTGRHRLEQMRASCAQRLAQKGTSSGQS